MIIALVVREFPKIFCDLVLNTRSARHAAPCQTLSDLNLEYLSYWMCKQESYADSEVHVSFQMSNFEMH